MGYFSNGTEGMAYQDQICRLCKRDGNCPVWDLHMLYNYDRKNEKVAEILDAMIPRTERGENGRCRYFEGES